MRKKLLSICVIALFIFTVLPLAKIDAGHVRNLQESSLTEKMFLCHITANGTGRFIWWLMGATFHGFGSIAVSTINFWNDGNVKIYSLLNPNKCFTITGNQSITLVGYIGYFITEPKDRLLHISIDGVALFAIDMLT